MKRSNTDSVPFDPVVFEDPVALDTEWTRIEGIGTSFTTHKIKNINKLKIEFHASSTKRLSNFVVIGFGLMILVYGQSGPNPMISSIIGSAIIGLGVYEISNSKTIIAFNKETGYYQKRLKNDIKDSAHLKEIHAIQILPKYHYWEDKDDGTTEYYSYELNLIYHDGTRKNSITSQCLDID